MGVFLFIIVFVVGGCQSQIKCDKPYIHVGTECCLDKNGNSICDTDEGPAESNNSSKSDTAAPIQNTTALENKTVNQKSDEEQLKEVAQKMGLYLERGRYAEIYDLLTKERQTYKTKDQFVELYPPIMYGYSDAYGSDGKLSIHQVNSNIFISEKVNEVIITGDEGLVYYDEVFSNGYQSKSPAYKFLKEDGVWKYNGFSYIVFSGCFNESDCYDKPDKLLAACQTNCKEQKKVPLRTNKPFNCNTATNQCRCICEGSSSSGAVFEMIYPDFK